MPIFRRTKALLLHLVCRSVTSGKTQILAVKSFLCSKPSWEIRVCLRMLCVNGCVVVLDWYLPRMFSGLVYRGAGVLMYTLCLFNARSVVQVLLGVTTRYVVNITLNLHLLYQPAHHRHTTSSNTCTTHSSHQTGTMHTSKHPPPIHQIRKHTRQITSPTPRHTHLRITFANTHEFPN